MQIPLPSSSSPPRADSVAHLVRAPSSPCRRAPRAFPSSRVVSRSTIASRCPIRPTLRDVKHTTPICWSLGRATGHAGRATLITGSGARQKHVLFRFVKPCTFTDGRRAQSSLRSASPCRTDIRALFISKRTPYVQGSLRPDKTD